MATLNRTQVAALLGRSLSDTENTNFDLYLNIAKLRLDDLICNDIGELETLPSDLSLVWARFFGVISNEQNYDGKVSAKKVEDFTINYREGYDPLADVIKLNAATIAKYSKCSNGIRHGRTIYDSVRCVS